MHTQLHHRLNISSTARRLCLILSCLLLFTSVGCGIPGRRCAQPGNQMPADYLWNNGFPFGRQTTAANSQSNDYYSQTGDINAEVVPERPELEPAKGIDKDSPNYSPQEEIRDGDSLEESLRKAESKIKPASYTAPIQDQPEEDIEKSIRDIEDDINRGDIKKPSVDNNDNDQQIQDIQDDIDDMPSETQTTPDGSQSKTESELLDEEYVEPVLSMGNDANSAQLPHSAFYEDPFLIALIQETMAGNQDLKILSEEIRIACNEAYARSGEYRPFVTLGAGVGYDKVGENTREGAVEENLPVSEGRAFPDPVGDFLVAGNISWEIDIWKRLRNAQRSAAMQYLGTQEGRNFIVTQMVARVAENYYDLLALDNRLLILQRTIEIQKASLKVAEGKKKAGRGTELAVQRFVAEVQKNRSEQAVIQQEIVEAENRINLLAGRYPQPVERITCDFVELNLNVLSAGVPSELLQNRADIRQAERTIQAAGLNLKVARARFYPNLSLTSGLGWNAFRSGFLFRTPENLIYSLAGELVGPLINKRAIQASYRTANAEQLQAIYDYQLTVLEANIEVVNELTKVENLRRSIELKKKQVVALQKSVEVATRLFKNARADYVDVLLSQRELMEAREVLIETKGEQLDAVVNAYQALGGGQF